MPVAAAFFPLEETASNFSLRSADIASIGERETCSSKLFPSDSIQNSPVLKSSNSGSISVSSSARSRSRPACFLSNFALSATFSADSRIRFSERTSFEICQTPFSRAFIPAPYLMFKMSLKPVISKMSSTFSFTLTIVSPSFFRYALCVESKSRKPADEI